MRKGLIALVLLALLFTAAVLNTRYIERMTAGLLAALADSREAMDAGDAEAALELAAATYDEWLSLDGYTHITIRHAEIDATSDAFAELLGDIAQGEPEACVGSYEKLRAHLDSIAKMERVTLGSIF